MLVNIARGSLVDEAALIEALARRARSSPPASTCSRTSRKVPEALLELDNAVLLPHVGSASVPTRPAMAELVVDNLFSWMDGKGPLTPVAGDALEGEVGAVGPRTRIRAARLDDTPSARRTIELRFNSGADCKNRHLRTSCRLSARKPGRS